MTIYVVRVSSWEENFTISVFSSEEKARSYCLATEWRDRYDLEICKFELDREYPQELLGEASPEDSAVIMYERRD